MVDNGLQTCIYLVCFDSAVSEFVVALSCTFFQHLFRCLELFPPSLLPGGLMNHSALVGGALRLLGCPRSHVRLMYQSPRDSLRLWLEQPTVCPDSGSFHRGMLPPRPPSRVHTRTWIAKVMQQSHQLCHSASACLRPQRCLLMWSCSLSPDPFPLNTASPQPWF